MDFLQLNWSTFNLKNSVQHQISLAMLGGSPVSGWVPIRHSAVKKRRHMIHMRDMPGLRFCLFQDKSAMLSLKFVAFRSHHIVYITLTKPDGWWSWDDHHHHHHHHHPDQHDLDGHHHDNTNSNNHHQFQIASCCFTGDLPIWPSSKLHWKVRERHA